MTRNATTPRSNDILRFALKEIHELYSHIDQGPCHTVAQWLFNEHGPYLRAEGFELSHLQRFFELEFPEVLRTDHCWSVPFTRRSNVEEKKSMLTSPHSVFSTCC